MTTKPSMPVQGRGQAMPVQQRQVEWLQALFAYAELHCNPELAVLPTLARQRRIQPSCWRQHRLLLDAHAALLCRFSHHQVQRMKDRACQLLLDRGEAEGILLGAYHELDAQRLIERCPFFFGDALANTYWEGWVAEPESAEDPAHTVSVKLAGLRDRELGGATPAERSLVIVAGHALLGEAGAGDTWSAAFEAEQPGSIEVCYAFWTQPLGPPSASGEFAIDRTTLVDAIPLTSGRAAWSVGARVLEGNPQSAEGAEQVLGAAVELIAAVSQDQRDSAEQPWQLPVMAAAQLTQQTVAAVLDAFSTLGAVMFEAAWGTASPACIYDSKYLYAVSPAAEPRSLTLPAGRYDAELEVAIGREPVSISSHRLERTSSPSQRWSMFRVRGAKGETGSS